MTLIIHFSISNCCIGSFARRIILAHKRILIHGNEHGRFQAVRVQMVAMEMRTCQQHFRFPIMHRGQVTSAQCFRHVAHFAKHVVFEVGLQAIVVGFQGLFLYLET